MPFTLSGMQRITQTVEHAPISRISLELTMDDGRSARGAANVLSQATVPGLWAASVPGETGALEQ